MGGRPGGAAPRFAGAAAVVALACAAYVLVIRPWHLHWGATEAEVRRALPGDDLVARPFVAATRAVTIEAPPAAVWPWLVQMGGYTRAGWYSYDRFDNAGRPSAGRIIPELQHLEPGDVMLTDERGGFTVDRIEPERSLVLRIDDDRAQISTSILLEPLDGGRTRMIFRLRARFAPGLRTGLFALAFDFGDFFFMRQQMLGIKHRAERAAAR